MKPPMHKPGPATKKRAAKTPPSMPMPGTAHDEMKYRAQDALHTLKRAHEIQKDPALMAHVQKHAVLEREALTKIARKRKT